MPHAIRLLMLTIFVGCAGAADKSATNGTTESPATSGNDAKKRIFVMTPNTTQGNPGGAAGADTKCNNASNKPSGTGTFKAIIADTSRRACTTANCTSASENLNWVMLPNTKYYRDDGATEIQTTNGAGVFTLPLAIALTENSHLVYTGIKTDWTNDGANNCSNWTSNSAGQNGRAGFSDSTTSNVLGQLTIGCDSGMHLLCVEQ